MGAPVSWFEVGSAEPDRAQEFYRELFGWSFTADTTTGLDYRIISTGEGHPVSGGIWSTAGEMPTYAVFVVQVPDVVATCSLAQEMGGSVLVPATKADSGLTFAHLRDRDGNHFGVFAPPPGA